jgi:hypothetical protein
MARKGKIARLPRSIRDELNRRLDDGAQGVQLLDWLNSLPEVQRVLIDSFEGHPITDGNLSDWKQGGFLEWQRLQEAGDWARTMIHESNHITAESGLIPFSDRLSAVVALSLGKIIRELAAGSLADEDAYQKFIVLLKQLTRLRQDDHKASRLRMDLETYEITLRDMLRQRSLTAVPVRSPLTTSLASLPATPA